MPVSMEIWALIGVGLIVAEFALPGLILVFLGLAALTVALLMAVGEFPTLAGQMTAFGVASVAYLLGLRSLFRRWLTGRREETGDGSGVVARLEGQRVEGLAGFAGGRGRVLLNGVKWDAESEDALSAGEAAIVEGKDGIRLQVRKL